MWISVFVYRSYCEMVIHKSIWSLLVFNHMSIIWNHVMNHGCPAGQPVVLCGKNFNIGHHTQTVQPSFYIPTMLIGTIDFNHFIPLSLTLTLPGGHMISAKENLLAVFSPTLFICWGWNLMLWWSNWSWRSWDCFWIRFVETKGITASCWLRQKAFNVGMHWDVYQSFESSLVWR